jgi:hypothetical protein
MNSAPCGELLSDTQKELEDGRCGSALQARQQKVDNSNARRSAARTLGEISDLFQPWLSERMFQRGASRLL